VEFSLLRARFPTNTLFRRENRTRAELPLLALLEHVGGALIRQLIESTSAFVLTVSLGD
jgi:hypothetical protein